MQISHVFQALGYHQERTIRTSVMLTQRASSSTAPRNGEVVETITLDFTNVQSITFLVRLMANSQLPQYRPRAFTEQLPSEYELVKNMKPVSFYNSLTHCTQLH